jgi:hypothetical protein
MKVEQPVPASVQFVDEVESRRKIEPLPMLSKEEVTAG